MAESKLLATIFGLSFPFTKTSTSATASFKIYDKNLFLLDSSYCLAVFKILSALPLMCSYKFKYSFASKLLTLSDLISLKFE